MARSRYFRNATLDGNQYGSFKLDQTNAIKEVDTFNGISTFEYTVKIGDRLDHLAAKHLSDDQYYWVIALINGIVFPLSIQPGDKLRIPTDIDEVLDRLA